LVLWLHASRASATSDSRHDDTTTENPTAGNLAGEGTIATPACRCAVPGRAQTAATPVWGKPAPHFTTCRASDRVRTLTSDPFASKLHASRLSAKRWPKKSKTEFHFFLKLPWQYFLLWGCACIAHPSHPARTRTSHVYAHHMFITIIMLPLSFSRLLHSLRTRTHRY